MKLYLLLSIGVLLSVTGCGGEEPAAPEQAAEATAPAEEAMAVEEPAVEAPVAEEKPYYFEGIIRHMHEHADQMDLINDALADGDLEASKAPARWLWRHDTMVGVPDDWQTYMAGMREAAREVDAAADLEAARVAAARITEQCQGCHEAVGINDEFAAEQ